MSPIGLDRSRRGEDVWLGQKMIFFAVGAGLGMGGMITGRQWLVWAAIAVLAAGLGLRIAARRRTARHGDEAAPATRDADADRPGDAAAPHRGRMDDPQGR
jgi:hypothetical protein